MRVGIIWTTDHLVINHYGSHILLGFATWPWFGLDDPFLGRWSITTLGKRSDLLKTRQDESPVAQRVEDDDTAAEVIVREKQGC